MSDEPSDRAALFLVALVASLAWLPLLFAPFPVMQDLSAHLETAVQVRDLLWGPHTLQGTYRLQPWPFPNSVPVLLLAVLDEVMDPLVAAKALLGLSAVLWPVLLGAFARALQRSPALALLAIPTIFDLSWSYGFFNFILGKPLWAGVLLLAVRGGQRDSGLPRLLALAVLLLLLFCTHLLLFSFAVAAAVWLIVVLGQGVRARLRALAAVSLGSAPGVSWMVSHRGENAGAVTVRSLPDALKAFWADLGDLSPGVLDGVSWTAAGLAFVALAIAGLWLRRSLSWRNHLALFVLAAGLLAFWAFGPIRTPLVSIVAERFLSLALAIAVLLPPVRVLRRWLHALAACVGISFGVSVLHTTAEYRAFSREDMGDFLRLLDKIPPGAALATYYVSPFSAHGRHNAAWHWPKLHVVYRGGRTDDSFAYRVTTWVTLTDEARRTGAIKRHNLDPQKLQEWDYLLVRGTSPAAETRLARDPITLVDQTGTWRLFRIERVEPTATPKGNPTPVAPGR